MKKLLVVLIVVLVVAAGYFAVKEFGLSGFGERDILGEIYSLNYVDSTGKEHAPDVLLRKTIWCGDYSKFIEVVEKGANLSGSLSPGGRTPLHWAAASGRLDMIDYLLANGVDPGGLSEKGFSPAGNSPLMEAAYFGHQQAAERFIRSGEKPDGPFPSGGEAYSPYMAAAFGADGPMVEMLLENGASGAYSSSSGDNALTMALISGYQPGPDLIELLVKNGADVNTVVDKGTDQEFTPLIAVALAGREDIYDLLVTLGADESYMDFFGKTAREYLEGATPRRELGKRELLQAATGDEYSFLYRVRVSYSGSGTCAAYMNGLPFAYIEAGRSGFASGEAELLFVAGDNTVEIDWLKSESLEEESGEKRFIDVSLARTSIFGHNETLWVKRLTQEEPDSQTSRLVFKNPASIDFSDLLQRSEVCNASREEWENNHKEMVKFVRKLLSAGSSTVTDAAAVYWTDEATAHGTFAGLEKKSFKRAIDDLKSSGFRHKAESDDQFVFLPGCGGRVWKVVVMDSPEAGRKLMEKLAMLPRAAALYDHELFDGAKTDEGFRISVPVFIAKKEGKFVIVR